MANDFEQFSYDMNIISKLSDAPNVNEGLSAGDLKAKFDEGGKAIKDYINNTLLPAALAKPKFTGLVKSDGKGIVAAKAGTDYLAEIPNGSVTKAKLGSDVTPAALGAASLDSTTRKVSAWQLAAPVMSITSDTTLSSKHAGHFLWTVAGEGEKITITIPKATTDASIPTTTEIEICRAGAGEVVIAAENGVDLRSVRGARAIEEQNGCAVLKHIGTNVWHLGGLLV